MAARCVSRVAWLFNRNAALRSSIVRQQSIFTKYREPPNGFLFNEKPRKPGEKRQWESWEEPWYRWWSLIIVMVPVLSYYKPDTSPQTWARKEALKIVAARDAAEAEEGNKVKAQIDDDDEDIKNFKLDWKPLM